jgi:methylenetetrahydrofolate dehydrogenase (NADP+)/methenyltetrahydrofolate cyclohydrolase
MALILDGKAVAQKIKDEIFHTYGAEDIKLTIVQVGDNPASNTYVRNKQKACDEVGIESKVVKLGLEEYERCQLLPKYLKEDSSDGVMLQLPLPEGWDEHYFTNLIPQKRDADCLTTASLGEFYASNKPTLAPCTAQGIIDILDYYDIPIEGKHAVVVGRSNIVGKPVAHLLTCRNATVTLCHSKTPNLWQYTKQADILVVAIGKPKYITADMVKPEAVVIDVGINRDENGKLCGDVDFYAMLDKVSAITPVPGGVGPMTVAELLKNTVKLFKNKKN